MLTKRAAEVRSYAVDFGGKLSPDELLAGTPTATELVTSALTISGVELNGVVRTIGGRIALVAQAVVFLVAGGVAGTTYTIRITVGTNATAAQTLIQEIQLRAI